MANLLKVMTKARTARCRSQRVIRSYAARRNIDWPDDPEVRRGAVRILQYLQRQLRDGPGTRVGPTYLIPSGIILPRILQTGLTYEF